VAIPLVLAVMASMPVAMFALFKKNRWL
jgi:hypothetical protein